MFQISICTYLSNSGFLNEHSINNQDIKTTNFLWAVLTSLSSSMNKCHLIYIALNDLNIEQMQELFIYS